MFIPITRGDSYLATFSLYNRDKSIHKMIVGEHLTFTMKTSKNVEEATISRYYGDGILFNQSTNKYEIELDAISTAKLTNIDYPFDIEYVSSMNDVKTLIQGVFKVCLDVTEPNNREGATELLRMSPNLVQNLSPSSAEELWADASQQDPQNEVFLGDFNISMSYREKVPQFVEITPREEVQTTRPIDEDHEIVEVITNPIPPNYKDISATTATSSDVLEGKQFIDAKGNTSMGSILTYVGHSSFVPSKETQIVSTANKYMSHDLVVSPIPREYADISKTTATSADVLIGKQFVDNKGLSQLGTLDVSPDVFGFFDKEDISIALPEFSQAEGQSILHSKISDHEAFMSLSSKYIGFWYVDFDRKICIFDDTLRIADVRSCKKHGDLILATSASNTFLFNTETFETTQIDTTTRIYYRNLDLNETETIFWQNAGTGFHIFNWETLSFKKYTAPGSFATGKNTSEDTSYFETVHSILFCNYQNNKTFIIWDKQERTFSLSETFLGPINQIFGMHGYNKVILDSYSTNSTIYTENGINYCNVFYDLESGEKTGLFSYNLGSISINVPEKHYMVILATKPTIFRFDTEEAISLNRSFTLYDSSYIKVVENFCLVQASAGNVQHGIYDLDNYFEELYWSSSGSGVPKAYSIGQKIYAQFSTDWRIINKETNIVSKLSRPTDIGSTIYQFDDKLYFCGGSSPLYLLNPTDDSFSQILTLEESYGKFLMAKKNDDLFLYGGSSIMNIETKEEKPVIYLNGKHFNGITFGGGGIVNVLTRKMYGIGMPSTSTDLGRYYYAYIYGRVYFIKYS